MPMLVVTRVIDSVQMNYVEIFVGKKHERRAAFLTKFFRRLGILWIDDPNRCAILKFLCVLDQLPELVIAPRSPLAAHENQNNCFS